MQIDNFTNKALKQAYIEATETLRRGFADELEERSTLAHNKNTYSNKMKNRGIEGVGGSEIRAYYLEGKKIIENGFDSFLTNIEDLEYRQSRWNLLVQNVVANDAEEAQREHKAEHPSHSCDEDHKSLDSNHPKIGYNNSSNKRGKAPTPKNNVTKNNVTKSQITQARKINILDYLKTHEPHNLKKHSSNSYKLADRGSVKIYQESGQWGFYCHKEQVGGISALDFLEKIRGVDMRGTGFVDAVKMLAPIASDEHPHSSNTAANKTNQNHIHSHKPIPDEEKEAVKPLLTLPPANWNNIRAKRYLTEQRGIDPEIVQKCIDQQIIYEAKNSKNCVFIGLDTEGIARYAAMRGTGDRKFTQDIINSTKSYGFAIPAKDPQATAAKALFVFESPIDLLSKATLDKQHPTKGHLWDSVHRLSLGGLSDKAVHTYLASNPNITTINLCLDNDDAGQRAAERITQSIAERYGGRYAVNTRLPGDTAI